MERYYFHIRTHDELIVDSEGEDFPNEDAARHGALTAVRELLAAKLRYGEDIRDDWMEVTNADGTARFTISFHHTVKRTLTG